MSTQRKYTFGPVPSRRLGIIARSRLYTEKTVHADCVYCEVEWPISAGLREKNIFLRKTSSRKVKKSLREYPNLEPHYYLCSGEPTLNSKIGDSFVVSKPHDERTCCCSPNGTLLDESSCPSWSDGLPNVSPSMDAVTPEVFEKVDRLIQNSYWQHHRRNKNISERIRGRMWMEILFVPASTTKTMKVYKNETGDTMDFSRRKFTLTRLFVRQHIHCPSQQVKNGLREIQKILGERSEIVGIFKWNTYRASAYGRRAGDSCAPQRRAMTVDQMTVSLEMKEEEIAGSLDQLLQGKCIRSYIFNGEGIFSSSVNTPACLFRTINYKPRKLYCDSAEKNRNACECMGVHARTVRWRRATLRWAEETTVSIVPMVMIRRTILTDDNVQRMSLSRWYIEIGINGSQGP